MPFRICLYGGLPITTSKPSCTPNMYQAIEPTMKLVEFESYKIPIGRFSRRLVAGRYLHLTQARCAKVMVPQPRVAFPDTFDF